MATRNFGWPVGTAVDLHIPNGNVPFTVPGLQVLRTIPSVGYSGEESSPINVAATAQYSWIRRELSGSRNYDPVDIITHEFALTQTFSYLNWLFRIYGYANVWSQMNKFIPKAILKAENIDVNNIRKNLPNFKYGINQLVQEIAQFVAPKTMPIFVQQAFMYAGIYQEGDSVKDQMYMYSPAGFYKYTTDGTWPNLEGKLLLDDSLFTEDHAPLTVDDLLDFGEMLVNNLLSQEDIGIMNGDLIRIYGTDTFRVSLLPDDFMINPMNADLNVLEQMKNATVYDKSALQMADFTIHQDPTKSYLMCTPAIRLGSTLTGKTPLQLTQENYMSDQILSTILIDPSPDDIMERTRGMACGLELFTNTSGVEVVRINSGAYIVVGCDVYFYNYTASYANPTVEKISLWSNMLLSAVDPGDKYGLYTRLSLISNFKFHPSICIWDYDGASEKLELVGRFFDIDNYGVLTTKDLREMHEVALMSLFNVPRLSAADI